MWYVKKYNECKKYFFLFKVDAHASQEELVTAGPGAGTHPGRGTSSVEKSEAAVRIYASCWQLGESALCPGIQTLGTEAGRQGCHFTSKGLRRTLATEDQSSPYTQRPRAAPHTAQIRW